MASQTLPPAEQVLHIPLANIELSKSNPRGGDIDEQELNELADDIANTRVQEPILVRPPKDGKGKFRLVFGERRYLASKRAEKQTIPCMVRAMSDEEAEEAQITENLQRANLHPLRDAAVFQRLYSRHYKQHKHHDEAIAHVASRVHKSAEHVARFLKLNDLIDAAKTAFRENQILLGHAYELSRLRENEQRQALQWMLGNHKDVETEKGWKKHRLMPSVDELKLWVRQHLFLDLSQAPFDVSDTTLNRKMGACTGCKFRSGSQPALFADVKSQDVCTVPACWAGKHNASLVNLTTTLARELGVDAVLKVGIGYASWNSSNVPVDVYIEFSSDARLVKEGQECEQTKPGLVTWIGRGEGAHKVGDQVKVCPNFRACSKHKQVDSGAERPRKSYEQMATVRVDNLRQDIPQRVRAALIRAVIEAAQKERPKISASDRTKFGLLARQMHDDLFFDRHRDLCKLMGVEPVLDKNRSKDWRATSSAMFGNHPVALMVAMTLMHRYHVGNFTGSRDPLTPLLQVYRVDTAAVEKKTKAEIQARIGTIKEQLGRRRAKQAKAAKAEQKQVAKPTAKTGTKKAATHK